MLVLEHGAVPRRQCPWTDARDVWYQDVIPRQSASCPVEWVDSEHPLFLLYTSGSTGKPKGVVHSTGGGSCMEAICKLSLEGSEMQRVGRTRRAVLGFKAYSHILELYTLGPSTCVASMLQMRMWQPSSCVIALRRH